MQDPNVIEAKVVISSCGHDGPMGAHSECKPRLHTELLNSACM